MRIVFMIVLSGLLSACAADPIQRQPQVQVEAVTHRMSMQLQSQTLNPQDRAAVADFIYRLGAPSALRVVIETHNRRGGDAVGALQQVLQQRAVYPSQVSSRYATPAQDDSADFTLVVESYRSLAPTCHAGKEPSRFAQRFVGSDNFGCANASALAQMVANPRDLVIGEALDPMEGRKAVTAMEAYYRAEAPEAPRAPQSATTATSGDQ
ncbi:CpaD family pilus assembly protein [Photobacterium sp. TY1-4]|uniref:CpaD family pilus assembly protein n=1 Tax=Photobacterium sp. TY1-4 TaxID=2899122 RepID=UPI0021C14425|nr:CpaD family pilus assembly protein [Photobacterium sp. TY1-4]UXI03625.1 CpaD family pilus assembly protein [Photobacterium sp. TY1-4]